MKRVALALAAAIFTASFAVSSYAADTSGGWTYEYWSGRWWYDYGNGYYPVDEWMWLDGNFDGVAECYKFNKEGYLLMSGWTPDGYYVNDDGAWTVNGVVQTQNWKYTPEERSIRENNYYYD